MKRSVVRVLVVCAMVATGAADARAQMSMGTFKGYLTGHVGAVGGGDVTNERLTGGLSVAVHERDGMGAEIDFGHTSDLTSGRQRLDLNTYMVSASFVKPLGTIRPFAVAGAGIVQINGCDSPCTIAARTYDLGFNAGGGSFLAVTDALGLRADARYFFSGAEHRDLHRPDNFGYWRLSIGATFMWSIVP